MKLLLAVLLIGTVVAQDEMVIAIHRPDATNRVELVSTEAVITFSGKTFNTPLLAQAGLTQEQIDAMATAPAAYQAVPQAPGYATETVMGSVIAILLAVVKIYFSSSRKNDAIAQTLIRGIELAGQPEVKRAVREIAAEEGQTTFLHKKVQKVTATDAAPTATSPPVDQGTGNTTG